MAYATRSPGNRAPFSAATIIDRVGRAILGLPARKRLTLRPTPAGILVLPAPDAPPTVIDMPSTQAAAAGDALVLASMPAPVRADSAPVGGDSASTPDDPSSTPMLPEMFRDFATADEFALFEKNNAEALARSEALEVRPAADHAMALLARLQSDPDTVGAVEFDTIETVYDDLLIDIGWRPEKWNNVAKHLRALTGSRKRYVSRDGGKVLIYDIPDPAADEIVEHYAASLDRAIGEACSRLRPRTSTEERAAA